MWAWSRGFANAAAMFRLNLDQAVTQKIWFLFSGKNLLVCLNIDHE